jgi:hypothetical protein
MKNLTEYINESLLTTVIAWLLTIILGILATLTIEIIVDTLRNNPHEKINPNLFLNIKRKGILLGFIEWFLHNMEDIKSDSSLEDFYNLCDKLSKDEEFIKWKSQPISKRRLKELKSICLNVFTENELKLGKKVIENMWKKYKNSANEYTDIVALENEIKTL